MLALGCCVCCVCVCVCELGGMLDWLWKSVLNRCARCAREGNLMATTSYLVDCLRMKGQLVAVNSAV